MVVTAGVLSLAVTSGLLSPLAPRSVLKDPDEAVGGALVSEVTQKLGQCRLLLIAAQPNTDTLTHVLR